MLFLKKNAIIQMKRQIQLFFTALIFYTKIPCPSRIRISPEDLNCAARYFQLVGILVGSISFLVYWGASFLFGISIAVILSLATGIIVTGAFHEDGFIDVFDGFGGGWDKVKILEIMKDSRIGSFGTIAAILMLLLKFYSLRYLATQFADFNIIYTFLIFISVHALSRLASGNLAYFSVYARDDGTSKVKPVEKRVTLRELIIEYIFGLLPLGVLGYYFPLMLWCLAPVALLIVIAKRYFEKYIGGYTGDCLGWTEQMSELLILLTFVAVIYIK